jgi:hypothetical protein
MIPVRKVFTKNDKQGVTKPLRITMPLCKNCRYFKEGDCAKFMYLNLVDGKETNVPALEARAIEMCGVGGSHFRPKVVESEYIKDE